MIILATAVILSLSSNGIISKAQSAKEANDKASMNEYRSVFEAEWELMTEEQREETGYSNQEDYVNAKLKEKGFAVEEAEEDEENYEGANEIAKDALSKGLKIGDEVKYPVEANTWTPDSSKTGVSNNGVLTAKTNLKWIYIGLSEEGELLITPDVSGGTSTLNFIGLYGLQGWLTGPDELNTTCDMLYSVDGKGTARSMDIDDVTRILGYTGEKGSYRDSDDNYVPTTEAKTIGDLEKELEKTISDREHPGIYKELGDYYSDFYRISKTDDVDEMKNSKYINLIFTVSGARYILASTCVDLRFSWDQVLFVGLLVEGSVVSSNWTFRSFHSSPESLWNGRLRPVVTLTSKIQKSTDDEGKLFWEFVS